MGTTVEVPMTGDADGAGEGVPRTGDANGAGEGTLMTGFVGAVVGAAVGAPTTGLGDETPAGSFVGNGKNDFGIGIGVGPGDVSRGNKIAPSRIAGFNVGDPGAIGCRERRLNTFFRIGDAVVGIAVSMGWGAEVGGDDAICGAILGNDEVDGFQLGPVLGRDDTLGADEEVGALLGNNDGTTG